MGLPQVENQHLTAPNMRRRLEWCTSILQRPGEAKKRHLGCCSFEAHISRSAHAIFLFVPSTQFFVVQFHAFPSQFLGLLGVRCLLVCVSVPSVVSMTPFHLQIAWSSQCSFETMRWQADASCSRVAAPRRRLVGRVLFTGCARSPTIRTRGSVG